MHRYEISGSRRGAIAVWAALAVIACAPLMGAGTLESGNTVPAQVEQSAEAQTKIETVQNEASEASAKATATKTDLPALPAEPGDTVAEPDPPERRNQVHLTTDPSGSVVTLKVMIAGPSINKDLYAFAFDLVLADPTVARYVPGSARVGDALKSGGGSTHVLAAQKGDRVTVGVTRLGASKGAAVATGEHEIVSLDFKLLKKKAATKVRFAGSPPHGPAAIDSEGAAIGSVHFQTVPTVIAAKG